MIMIKITIVIMIMIMIKTGMALNLAPFRIAISPGRV